MIFSSFSDVLGMAVAFNFSVAALYGTDLSDKVFVKMAVDEGEPADSFVRSLKAIYPKNEIVGSEAIANAQDDLKKKLDDDMPVKYDFSSEFKQSSLPCVCLFLGAFGLFEMIVDGFGMEILSNYLLYWNIAAIIAVTVLFCKNSKPLWHAVKALYISAAGGVLLYMLNSAVVSIYSPIFYYNDVYSFLKLAVLIPFIGLAGLFWAIKRFRKNVRKKRADFIAEVKRRAEEIDTVDKFMKKYTTKADGILKTIENC